MEKNIEQPNRMDSLAETAVARQKREMLDEAIVFLKELVSSSAERGLAKKYKDLDQESRVSRIKEILEILEAGGFPENAATEMVDRELMGHEDKLTGLYRFGRIAEFYDYLVKNTEEGKYTAVVAMDVNDFKPVNDEHGHLEGDEVLKTIGQVIRGQLREYDIAERKGGDEFTLLLPNVTKDSVEMIMKRIMIKINESLGVAGNNPLFSIGVCLVEKNGVETPNFNVAYKQADGAAYVVKGRKDEIYKGQASPIEFVMSQS